MHTATKLLPAPRRFTAWLAVAVLLHAGLLWLPLHSPDLPLERLTPLRLVLPPAARPPARLEELPAPPAARADPAPPATRAIEPHPSLAPPVAAEEPPAPETAEPPALDASSLTEAVRAWERGRGLPPRELGVFRAPGTPPNWRPAPVPGENRFDSMTAPAEVHVVDRWLAADGSHNVVVELPNGETLCGRAEAWNPMQPLVEHVMMFRRCGGGGERSFEMPERFRRER